jgi:hypothetical protein
MGYSSGAQRSNQAWVDYELHFPFANDYEFKAEAGYRTVLSEQSKWRSFRVTPILDWSVTSFADLSVEAPLIYTVQTDTFNTFETRLVVGGIFYITANRRIETRAGVKWENRYLKDESADEWKKSNRFRLRGIILTAINHKNHYEDKLWYAILDGEVFYVLDDDVPERFANRIRLGLGIGYRLNYNFRFELLYLGQQSRNALDDDSFVTDDSIIRFRYKHYINKAKPKSSTSPQ